MTTNRFYVEGIHCSSCIRRINQALKDYKKVISFHASLSDSTLVVQTEDQSTRRAIPAILSRLGFRARLIETEDEIEKAQLRENRSLLIRVGVAASITANIMILSVANYAGASGGLSQFFQTLSFLLCLPAVFYCALPFFKSSFEGLKKKVVTIDLPIALAVSLGFGVSVVKYLRGDIESYFDSISMFVFLILSSRYVLARFKQRAFQKANILNFSLPNEVRLSTGEYLNCNDIKEGEFICFSPGEIVSFDGVLQTEKLLVSQSTLTGESVPIRFNKNDIIHAGSQVLEGEATLKVLKSFKQSRLSKIISQVEHNLHNKTPFLQLVDRIASYFVIFVLAGSLVAALSFHAFGISDSLERIMAFLIVMCPCALALATPLTLSVSQSIALRYKILVLEADIFEKIRKANQIFFDKTGTLTKGQFEVLSWRQFDSFKTSDLEAIYGIEKKQFHPVAQAIKRKIEKIIKISDFESSESIVVERSKGGGIQSTISGDFWRIFPVSFKNGHHEFLIQKNEITIVSFKVGDQVRDEAKGTIDWLSSNRWKLSLLSGDKKEACLAIAEDLSFENGSVYFEKTPEEKSKIINQNKNSIMLGDGFNDVIALKHALVGIATKGGIESAVNGADVYFMSGGVDRLKILLELARENEFVTRRNLVVSLIYNLVGATAALSGFISPLVAAILMPISAFTVFVLSFWRRSWKLSTFFSQ